MRKYTEARKQGNKKWDDANLDRISIALPRGYKEVLTAAAARSGCSVNAYIRGLIEKDNPGGLVSIFRTGEKQEIHQVDHNFSQQKEAEK